MPSTATSSAGRSSASQSGRAAGFRAGDTHHDLLLIEVGLHAQPVPAGRRLGMYHFGVKVGDSDDDLRALLDRLQARPDLVTVVGAVTVASSTRYPRRLRDGALHRRSGYDWNDPNLFDNAPRKPLVL